MENAQQVIELGLAFVFGFSITSLAMLVIADL